MERRTVVLPLGLSGEWGSPDLAGYFFAGVRGLWHPATSLGLGVGVGATLEITLNLAEILDFVFGLATVDLLNDDLYRVGADFEEETEDMLDDEN